MAPGYRSYYVQKFCVISFLKKGLGLYQINRSHNNIVSPINESMGGKEMSQITEIAPDVFKITTFFSEENIQFNQFLVRDEEPLLYHTGMKGAFPDSQGSCCQID